MGIKDSLVIGSLSCFTRLILLSTGPLMMTLVVSQRWSKRAWFFPSQTADKNRGSPSRLITAAILAAILVASLVVTLGPLLGSQSASAAPITHMQDTTSSSGQNIWSGRPIQAEYVSPSSVLVEKQIDTIA